MDFIHIESLLQLGVIAAYTILFGVIFAESGLLIGFFLPGDSLLFTAGFLASQGLFNVYVLVVGFFLAAVVGDSVGYWFGHKVGRRLFNREESLLFHKDNLARAEKFYEKHGKKTIIIARFLPIVRTFAPIVAGMGKMHYPTFLTYNIIGGVLWAAGITLLGYFLGGLIPGIDKYLIPIILLIVIASVAPTAYHILKEKENREALKKTIRNLTNKNKD